MGWGDCGKDSRGRNIGYVFPAKCDHPGCKKRIHRGLAYVCGTMHGADEYTCEGYFCEEHRRGTIKTDDGDYLFVCKPCETAWRKANPKLARKLDRE